MIVGDNAARGSAVVNEDNACGDRAFIDMLSKNERLDSIVMQTVGEKGWDDHRWACSRCSA